MQNIDYTALYEQNEDFKRYVDRYCTKHRVSVAEALQHYEWLLNRYAKPGDIILDTHVGSASSLIACYRTNHPYVGFELDKHYYDLSKKRLDAEMAQMRLSDFIPGVMP